MSSPVAAFESESPSVQRKDIKCYPFDPLLCPIIVIYRIISSFFTFFGHILLEGFDCGPCDKYWVTMELFNNFSEIDELFRHAANSCWKDWCFLITGGIAPANVLGSVPQGCFSSHWLPLSNYLGMTLHQILLHCCNGLNICLFTATVQSRLPSMQDAKNSRIATRASKHTIDMLQ